MTAKSDRVKRLMEDQDLKQAFADVEAALFKQFKQCPPSEQETLRVIKERLHLLQSVEANLYQAIEHGEIEDFNAMQDEKPGYLGDILSWRKKQQHKH